MTVYWLLSQLRAWAHAWSRGVAEMEARMGLPHGAPLTNADLPTAAAEHSTCTRTGWVLTVVSLLDQTAPAPGGTLIT